MNWEGWEWTGGQEYNEKYNRLEITLHCKGPKKEYVSVFFLTNKMLDDWPLYYKYLMNIVPAFIKYVEETRLKDEKV